MSNPSKQLGTALEHRLVRKAREHGLRAVRQPGSGVYSNYPNDAEIGLENGDALLVECKVRSRHPSYTEMQEWLEGCQANAAKHGYEGAVLVYNTKGSRTPRVMLDLNLFLRLISQKCERA